MDNDKKLNILIADDEEGLRFSLASILEMEDYEVKTAQDGLEALELVKTNDFDLAFFDIRMPGMNGVEALKNIKQSSPETIVVMMTAYAMNDLIKEAIKEGAFACISKPFEIDDILNTVKEISIKPVAVVVSSDYDAVNFLEQNLQPAGYIVINENNLEKVGNFIKRRQPELIFMDFSAENAAFASKMKREAGYSPKIIMMGKSETGTADFSFVNKPLRKSDINAFINRSGKKKVALISSDTINSNNLKLAIVAKGYDASYYTSPDQFFSDPQWDTFDFVVAEAYTAVNEMEKCYIKMKERNGECKAIFIFDYETPVSENLKKQNIPYLQKPFDPQDLLELMEKE